MRLFELPHASARAAVATGAPVFLHVNPVEYHGPHLPLRNDALITDGLTRDLHARLAARHAGWPLLLAGDVEVGVDPTPGIGSRHTSFAAARTVVREACRSLAELGAKRVVLMTFHGAPLHNLAIEAGVELLDALGVRALAPFNAVMRRLLDAKGSDYAEGFAGVEDAAEREEMMRDLALDFHGGFFETSMTLHYAPASVAAGYRSVPPCPPIVPSAAWMRAAGAARRAGAETLARELALSAYAMGWHALKPFPGYTGRPHHADAAAGAYFAKRILDEYETLAEDVLLGTGRSPAPVMPWLAAATLGGRLAPVPPSAAFPEHVSAA